MDAWLLPIKPSPPYEGAASHGINEANTPIPEKTTGMPTLKKIAVSPWGRHLSWSRGVLHQGAERRAPGTPAGVTNEGGPRFIVRSGDTGFMANNLQEFCASILGLATRAELRQNMGAAARAYAMTISWGTVFDSVFAGDESTLRESVPAGKKAGCGLTPE